MPRMATTLVTASVVRRVRRLINGGASRQSIAKRVGLSPATISNIANGRRDHILEGKKRRAPVGADYCEACHGVYQVPCPRCAALAKRTAEIHHVLKWDNIEPIAASELPDGLAYLATKPEADDRWTLAEGGAN